MLFTDLFPATPLFTNLNLATFPSEIPLLRAIMCFTLQASLAYAAVGYAVGVFLYFRGRQASAWGLFVYFAVMETLQALQYAAMASETDAAATGAPACMGAPGRGSFPNKMLMIISWAHICFQPYIVNKCARSPATFVLRWACSSCKERCTVYDPWPVPCMRRTLIRLQLASDIRGAVASRPLAARTTPFAGHPATTLQRIMVKTLLGPADCLGRSV